MNKAPPFIGILEKEPQTWERLSFWFRGPKILNLKDKESFKFFGN